MEAAHPAVAMSPTRPVELPEWTGDLEADVDRRDPHGVRSGNSGQMSMISA